MSYRVRLHPAVSADLDAIVHWLVDYAGLKATIAFTVDDDTREVWVHAVTYAGADWIGRSMARR